MWTRRTVLITLFVLGLVTAGAGAHAADPPAPDTYRLSGLDVIEVIVIDEPTYSAVRPNALTIAPDGTVGLPQIGQVPVAGLTCAEAAAAIARRLAGRIVLTPQVMVRVVDYHSQQVNALGALRNPGSFPYRPDMTVRDLIGLAGGFAGSDGTAPLPRDVRLIRGDGSVQSLSLQDALAGTGPAAGLALRPGDSVIFDENAPTVVLGFVQKPGTYAIPGECRLSELVARAGGPTPGADLTRLVINRTDGTVVERDLEKILAGTTREDPVVRAGDVVYVPRTIREVMVLGYVLRPGTVAFEPGWRASDILGAVGGPATGNDARGDLAGVTLTSRNGAVRTLNLAAALAGTGTEADNPTLQPGDVLMVPAARDWVVVSGYVKVPGQYRLQAGQTVSAAITLAGGPSSGLASQSEVQVRHASGETVTVDLKRADPPLQPGDSVTVPFARDRVAVLGAVGAPGLYPCYEGMTVVELLATAGGALGERPGSNFQTNRGSARVFLVRHEQGQDVVRELNLRPFYREGKTEANVPVLPGDVLYVPTARGLDGEAIFRDLLLLPRLVD